MELHLIMALGSAGVPEDDIFFSPSSTVGVQLVNSIYLATNRLRTRPVRQKATTLCLC